MVKIVINNQVFHCPSDWDDVTIKQIAELRRLTLMLSGDVKDKLAVRYEPSAIRETDSLQDTSLFDSDWTEAVFCLMCMVPMSIIRVTDPKHIAFIVERYLMRFIIGVIFEPDYEPRGIEVFEWNGERLYMPKSTMDIAGRQMPFSDASVIELCEATDLYNVDRMMWAALIVAILCRPELEKFDEEKVKERAKNMVTLPMSIALEVFFCSSLRMNI